MAHALLPDRRGVSGAELSRRHGTGWWTGRPFLSWWLPAIHPVPWLFSLLVFSGSFPCNPLKVQLLAGDLRAAQLSDKPAILRRVAKAVSHHEVKPWLKS